MRPAASAGKHEGKGRSQQDHLWPRVALCCDGNGKRVAGWNANRGKATRAGFIGDEYDEKEAQCSQEGETASVHGPCPGASPVKLLQGR